MAEEHRNEEEEERGGEEREGEEVDRSEDPRGSRDRGESEERRGEEHGGEEGGEEGGRQDSEEGEDHDERRYLTPEQIDKLRDHTQRLLRVAPDVGDGRHETAEDFLEAVAEDCEKKRLFVCCDGTWKNAAGTVAPLTNVAKISRAVWRLGSDDLTVPEENIAWGARPDEKRRYGFVRQIVYYSSGVGSLSSLSVDSLFSGATGRGVDANILSAYCFICNNFNGRSWLDEIILVGFSRGAFTVRCLANFIDKVGLLRRKGLVFLRSVYLSWKKWAGGKGVPAAEEKLRTELDALGSFRLHPIRIKVLAEWDCVSSMRSPRFFWRKGSLSFVKDEVPACVDNAFHAVALHEKRRTFKPMLWKTRADPETTVRQCAFAGCHSDIGGGNCDAGLSTASLLWMIAQIRDVSRASFDPTTLLQFVAPLPISYRQSPVMFRPLFLREAPRKNMCLYNLVCAEGRVHESRRGVWSVPYYLSFSMLDGKRDLFWKKCAEFECLHRDGERRQPRQRRQQGQQEEQEQQGGQWQPLQHKYREELESDNPVSVRIHFTARLLLQGRLKRDHRLRCGLFRGFELDTGLGGEDSWKWVTRGSLRWFLSEDGIVSHEKELLDRWIQSAIYRGQEPDGHFRDDDIDVEWRDVINRLGQLDWEEYIETYPWEKSFIRLVSEEFSRLGVPARERGAA